MQGCAALCACARARAPSACPDARRNPGALIHSASRLAPRKSRLPRKELVDVRRREKELEAEQAQLADLSEPLRRTQLGRRQEKEQSRLTMRMIWDAQVKEEAKVATSQIPII